MFQNARQAFEVFDKNGIHPVLRPQSEIQRHKSETNSRVQGMMQCSLSVEFASGYASAARKCRSQVPCECALSACPEEMSHA